MHPLPRPMPPRTRKNYRPWKVHNPANLQRVTNSAQPSFTEPTEKPPPSGPGETLSMRLRRKNWPLPESSEADRSTNRRKV
jgi:hypothetical protein